MSNPHSQPTNTSDETETVADSDTEDTATESDSLVTTTDFDDVRIPGAVPSDESSESPTELESESHEDRDSSDMLDTDFSGVSIDGAVETDNDDSEIEQVEEDTTSTVAVMIDDETPSEESEALDAEPSSEAAESDEAVVVDTDFSGVSIDGAEDNDASNDAGRDTDSVDPETYSETHNFSNQDADNAGFSDPDAAETWGSESVDTAFEDPFERQTVDESEVAREEDSVVVAEPSPDESIDDEESEPVFADSGVTEVDTDFSGISIDGATEADESTPAGESDVTGGTAGESPTEQSSTSDRGVPAAEPVQSEEDSSTSSNGSGGATARVKETSQSRSSERSSDTAPVGNTTSQGETTVGTPEVVPEQRIRGPNEILGEPLRRVVDGTQTLALIVYGFTLLGIRATTILMEWATSIFLIFYGIFVGMALIFPSGAIPHIGGSTTRMGAIVEASIVVIPMTIVVFAVSIGVDKLINDGERYKTEPPVERL